MEECFKLISWEGDEFEVPLISRQMIDFLDKVPEFDNVVSLADLEIDTETLKIILDFCELKCYTPSSSFKRPVTSNEPENYIDNPIDIEFIRKISDEQLIKLSKSAHKLNVFDLVDLCAIRIAMVFAKYSDADLKADGFNVEIAFEHDEYMRIHECDWINT